MKTLAPILLAAAVLMAGVLVVGPPATAQDSQAKRYATSRAPYWTVGTLNRDLSRNCQQSRFNQKRIADLYIAFIGPEGRGITGIAQRGWNLYDPTGLADPAKTYHFYADGTSSCQVYEAP